VSEKVRRGGNGMNVDEEVDDETDATDDDGDDDDE
jgi:hypothetical protein